MKKLTRKTSKLNLKAETIQQLTQTQLGQVVGGALPTAGDDGGCVARTQSCHCPTNAYC